jgi:hypothetical protein
MTTEMCQHIIDHGTTDTHMVLIVTESESAFTCPQCTADYAIALLDSTGPDAILDSLVFSACDHTAGTCNRCLESLKDELATRWSRLKLTPEGKPAANRLGRLRKAISKRYDTSESKPLPVYRNASLQGLAGVRGRAGQAWTQARNQRINTLVPPVHTVLVVPASLG